MAEGNEAEVLLLNEDADPNQVHLQPPADNNPGYGNPANMRGTSIQAGVSLLGTTVQQELRDSNRSRACIVKIVNHSNWTLECKGIFPETGRVFLPQQSIEPRYAEIFFVQKKALSLTGTSGTASYLVERQRKSQYLNIMWSIPYSRSFNENRMSIEISNVTAEDAFKTLYNPRREMRNCKMGIFDSKCKPLELNINGLRVNARMGTSSKTEIIVDIYDSDS